MKAQQSAVKVNAEATRAHESAAGTHAEATKAQESAVKANAEATTAHKSAEHTAAKLQAVKANTEATKAHESAVETHAEATKAHKSAKLQAVIRVEGAAQVAVVAKRAKQYRIEGRRGWRGRSVIGMANANHCQSWWPSTLAPCSSLSSGENQVTGSRGGSHIAGRSAEPGTAANPRAYETRGPQEEREEKEGRTPCDRTHET